MCVKERQCVCVRERERGGGGGGGIGQQVKNNFFFNSLGEMASYTSDIGRLHSSHPTPFTNPVHIPLSISVPILRTQIPLQGCH